MNRFMVTILFLFLSIMGCYRPEEETAIKGNLLISVSESLQPLIQKEADEFCQTYAEAHLTIKGATTRESIVYLLNDSLNIIISDRRLNAEEQQVAKNSDINLQEIRIAEDALAVLVNAGNGLENISGTSLKEVLTRKITVWNELPESKQTGPIALAITGRNSGAYELLENYFDIKDGISPSKAFTTQDEVMSFVSAHPQAIGFISLACFKNPSNQPTATSAEPLTVRTLAIAGTDSVGQIENYKLHQANIYYGKYPLHFPVYIYLHRDKSPLANGFTSFITSGRGQQIILAWGLVPATQPVRIIQLN
jgi:phosphate transport system substrate-binding protein